MFAEREFHRWILSVRKDPRATNANVYGRELHVLHLCSLIFNSFVASRKYCATVD